MAAFAKGTDMSKKLCIIDGHPDADPSRFGHALCDAYYKGAASAGHVVSLIRIADLDIQPLASVAAFDESPSQALCEEREKISSADHVMLEFPLWLGSMPAATRAFFEQIACANFFFEINSSESKWPKRMMKGKSVRIIVTMGMPAVAYRILMGNASLKALERGILGIAGFRPVRHTILGGVESVTQASRNKWLDEVRSLGATAQ